MTNLTVINANDDQQLTTLETVRLELGSSGISNDKTLTRLIREASDFITAHTGRNFIKEEVEEKLPANQSPNIMLERTPIASITSITHFGSTIGSTTFSIHDPKVGIIFRDTGWFDSRLFKQNIELTPTRYAKLSWVVRYIGGFEPPGSSSPTTLPEDVERACIDLVKAWFLDIDSGRDPRVRRQQTGDASESFFEGSARTAGFPPSVLRVLEKYERLD